MLAGLKSKQRNIRYAFSMYCQLEDYNNNMSSNQRLKAMPVTIGVNNNVSMTKDFRGRLCHTAAISLGD